MPLWAPDKRWAGRDVYVIGGGPSLTGFDFSLLKGKTTIGCNAAFKLGVELCSMCFFSDPPWFYRFESELSLYAQSGGTVVTHAERLLPRSFTLKWLLVVRRAKRGLHQNVIGLNSNSGCSAVNLALILGARRVFLLGFDCRMPTDIAKSHWHDWRIVAPNRGVYDKFMTGWETVAREQPTTFPESKIINLGPDSAIEFFPKAHYSEYLYHATHDTSTG